jgi:hypothetical protein
MTEVVGVSCRGGCLSCARRELVRLPPSSVVSPSLHRRRTPETPCSQPWCGCECHTQAPHERRGGHLDAGARSVEGESALAPAGCGTLREASGACASFTWPTCARTAARTTSGSAHAASKHTAKKTNAATSRLCPAFPRVSMYT